MLRVNPNNKATTETIITTTHFPLYEESALNSSLSISTLSVFNTLTFTVYSSFVFEGDVTLIIILPSFNSLTFWLDITTLDFSSFGTATKSSSLTSSLTLTSYVYTLSFKSILTIFEVIPFNRLLSFTLVLLLVLVPIVTVSSTGSNLEILPDFDVAVALLSLIIPLFAFALFKIEISIVPNLTCPFCASLNVSVFLVVLVLSVIPSSALKVAGTS